MTDILYLVTDKNMSQVSCHCLPLSLCYSSSVKTNKQKNSSVLLDFFTTITNGFLQVKNENLSTLTFLNDSEQRKDESGFVIFDWRLIAHFMSIQNISVKHKKRVVLF